MAAKKNDLWLVPEAQNEPVVLPTPPSGSAMSYEEREVARKYRAHIAEEIAKGVETLLVAEIVDGINRDYMNRGVDMIEFGYTLRREGSRDAEEQKTVDAFLGMAVSKALQDGLTTATIGIRGEQDILRGPLTPDTKKWYQR
jgi:hypothetical protein